MIAALVLSACSSSDGGPTAPAPPDPPSVEIVGDPEAGALAFVASCTECHTSRDGFDLAHFAFASRDVIRRSLGHVDMQTSHDIDAYIRSLDVRRATPRVSPFQTGGKTVVSDLAFWRGLFGTDVWPTGLTAAALRAIDPRDVPVPIPFAVWSSENSNEDWLPDTPLHGDVLDYGGGTVRTALSDYYYDLSEENLVRVLAGFDEASKSGGGLCWRPDPEPCFNARRWMSTLAAQHYLRVGETPSVPVEVAQVWWDVGESGIAQQALARSAEERDRAFRNGARWMYMGFAFAPEAFEEPAGYMGTFLIGSQQLRRVATFAALRRMVGNGRAHQNNSVQVFHDGKLAAGRAPRELGLDVAEFVLGHFVDRLETGRPADLNLVRARFLVTDVWTSARRWAFLDATQAARIRQLLDRVLLLLQ